MNKFSAMIGLSAAAAATFLSTAPASAAETFDGATVEFEFVFPVQNNVIARTDVTVSDNVEITSLGGIASIDISDTNIRLFDFNFFGVFLPTPFNGFVIRDTNDALSPISGVSVGATNLFGLFSANDVGFTDDSISVNLSGTVFTRASELSLDVAFAPPPAVPEPATWLMMILGLGLVGGAMRRRNSTIVTTPAFA